jgi:twitching motility protein PilT
MSDPRGGDGGGTPGGLDLRAVLREMVQRGASDLHLKVGRPPVVRVNGRLEELPQAAVSLDELLRCVAQITSVEQRAAFESRREADFALGVKGLGRFRVHLFFQRGTPGISIRAIPFEVPALERLNLPEVLREIALVPRGLVLVTGTTGSGKSTTLASMLRYLNERRAVNITTVEDPIEFLHRDVRAFVSQREVGADTLDYHDALRTALRQDPDVIMVGEIRDAEAMEAALKAANTGHLVLSTLHTTDAVQTLNRILSFFSAQAQPEVRWLLAEVLRAVVSLRLISREDGSGRIPAVEVLVNTASVAERIRAGDRIHTIPELIAEGRMQYGMQSFDQSLMHLYRSGMVSFEYARQFASNPAEFALRASGIQSGSDAGWSESPAMPPQR